jgi:predicted transcriptional regulator
MVNVKKRHLLELLPQHKTNSLNELNALDKIRKVKQLDMTEVVKAWHVTFPQKVPLETGAEDVNEKVET